MDRDGTGTHPPLARHESANWSVEEPSEEQEPDVDVDNDIEQNEIRPELSRATTGPPYTIFSPRAKMFIVLSVSVSGLISPLGAVTFYPALNTLARELNVTPSMINVALTTYMVCSVHFKQAHPFTDVPRLLKPSHRQSSLACPTPVAAACRSSFASSSTLWPT